MANYFCAKIPQEHSEFLRLLALEFGVSNENIFFSPIGCQFCKLYIYIKFEKIETLRKFSELSAPFIIEKL